MREMTASIKRYISGHYTAKPWNFRKLLIWIIAFVDNFIASFVSHAVPSYFHLLWLPLQFNLLGCFCYSLFYFQAFCFHNVVHNLLVICSFLTLTPNPNIIIKNTNVVMSPL